MTNNFYQTKENIFNLWAPYYDCWFTTFFYQAIHHRLLAYVELPKHASVLDIGCGTGLLLNRLAAKLTTVKGIGLDLSPLMLRRARAQNRFHKRLIFVSGNTESLCFAEEQFDAVFCTMSFLHYPQPQQVLHQISRVLADGGKFYLVDVDLGELNFSRFLPGIGEIRFYSRDQRASLGAKAGLHAIAHHSLLPGILLTIFSTNSTSSTIIY